VCGGTDDVNHELGVRQHRDVAAVNLVGSGAHTLRHKALQLGLHRAVTRRHDVLAGLRPPGGAFNFLVEQVRGWRKVRRPDNFLL